MRKIEESPLQLTVIVATVIAGFIWTMQFFSAMNSGTYYDGGGGALIAVLLVIFSPLIFLWALIWIVCLGASGRLTNLLLGVVGGIGLLVPAFLWGTWLINPP